MKDIKQLIEAVESNPEFRAKFMGLDEAGIEKMLKDEGYDVTMNEVLEAAQMVNIELSPEELEKIAGGKESPSVGSIVTLIGILTGLECFF